MDEIFGEDAHLAMIAFTKGATGLTASGRMPARLDYIIWYGKSSSAKTKYRQLYTLKNTETDNNFKWVITKEGVISKRTGFEKAGGNPLENCVRLGQDVSLIPKGSDSIDLRE